MTDYETGKSYYRKTGPILELTQEVCDLVRSGVDAWTRESGLAGETEFPTETPGAIATPLLLLIVEAVNAHARLTRQADAAEGLAEVLEDLALQHQQNAITQEGLAISNRSRGDEWLSSGGITIVRAQESDAAWHRKQESKARAALAAYGEACK